MSTYAVFGMTKHRAVELARQAIDPWHKEERRPMTMEEWSSVVEAAAAETMAGTRTIQLSEKFDAPQFAREFLELAKKSESRSLHIKAYSMRERDPTTGRKIMHWTDAE